VLGAWCFAYIRCSMFTYLSVCGLQSAVCGLLRGLNALFEKFGYGETVAAPVVVDEQAGGVKVAGVIDGEGGGGSGGDCGLWGVGGGGWGVGIHRQPSTVNLRWKGFEGGWRLIPPRKVGNGGDDFNGMARAG